jgi:dTDP-4-dehydrorhamnose 3,5-epimerase-like enzyme
MGDISGMFTAMYREMFGRTKYSYAHMGHHHHHASKEDGNMIVRQHRTMAVKDAYSARGGYISDRSASVITYSKTYGQVAEVVITAEMVKCK